MDVIRIRGARENNLKNISIDIPKNKITVFTGVSGSGKSSLVFETIGAEAQRQFNETYDSYLRSRMPHYGHPEIDSIQNLNVAIIINQKRLGGNARSTVGTATDIYTLLRLLFSRIGEPFVGYSMVFSFNNPKGMCPACEGLGTVTDINLDMLIDKNKSLNEGAIRFPAFQPGGWRWTRYVNSGYFDNDKKLKKFSKDELQMLLYATEHKPKNPTKEWGKTMLYEGIIPRIKRSFLKKETKEFKRNEEALREILQRQTCPECKGARLNKEVLRCKIQGKNIADCSDMQISHLIQFLKTIQNNQVRSVLDELIARLTHLENIGLAYLSLSRGTASLSGGESQRIKMVRHLGSSLTGLLYIFDEPSIGLHPNDIDRLTNIIRQLRDKGNTVLIVEHDPDIIKMADHVVDMGPGAGKDGGHIVFSGPLKELKHADTLTGKFWRLQRTVDKNRRSATAFITIKNARLHNLKNVTVKIPLHVITVVTGVAGSGKSSLINHELPRQYPQAKLIDQGFLRGSRRSHLASYTGIFDELRNIFAKTNQVSASLFSANAQGACPQCKGLGIIRLDLAFMEEVEETCDLCQGTGYRQEVLDYKWNGKNIVQILKMSVAEASVLFEGADKALLNRIADMGLGYMTLGQPLSTFSGGERQRLKLAMEFDEQGQLFVFDEPTTGLHPADIEKLMATFHRLADRGNTVIIVEHNLDVIAQADWIIDMGPGGGSEGGQVVFEGMVSDLVKHRVSKTGFHLSRYAAANA
ncbi:ATP-binding cassette domain-containing protein [Longitalea arenae]|uniref:ATP-binding cassette domain-containing protein n=1 Tax=Longitalea arenae TaxID=2812558 RepID=UPI0019673F7C|nr:excinuclease ABC subunit UvrA [Longitalea arenae]